MRQIITISREVGAGGREVGKRVAQELGIAFYDRDIILKTAEHSSDLTAEDIRRFEEKPHHSLGLTQSLFDLYSRPLDEKVWEAQVKAIRALADKESCVIVGRNANYILREFDHHTKVFLYGDKEKRIERVKITLPDSTYAEREKYVTQVDKQRSNYCMKLTGVSYGDARNYDLCLNSWAFGLDKTIELILSAVK